LLGREAIHVLAALLRRLDIASDFIAKFPYPSVEVLLLCEHQKLATAYPSARELVALIP
jgi:hypothetical protein